MVKFQLGGRLPPPPPLVTPMLQVRKKGVRKFYARFLAFSNEISIVQKIVLSSSRGRAIFEDLGFRGQGLDLRGQGLQNVSSRTSSRPRTSSRTPPLITSKLTRTKITADASQKATNVRLRVVQVRLHSVSVKIVSVFLDSHDCSTSSLEQVLIMLVVPIGSNSIETKVNKQQIKDFNHKIYSQCDWDKCSLLDFQRFNPLLMPLLMNNLYNYTTCML